MASGFVYLRPKTVAYFRETGPRCTSADLAWRKMLAWLDQHDLRHEVDRGFGIFDINPLTGSLEYYDACIELPPATSEEARAEVKFQKLPGGAYARCLHKGPHELIGDILSELQQRQQKGSKLAIDPNRPTIEIYLNDPREVSSDKLRTDICLPVSTQPYDKVQRRAA